MADSVTVLDVIAMLEKFITAFILWVAWEIIIGQKALALLLAIGAFVASWVVGGLIGAMSPFHFLIVEGFVAAVVFRVAKD